MPYFLLKQNPWNYIPNSVKSMEILPWMNNDSDISLVRRDNLPFNYLLLLQFVSNLLYGQSIYSLTVFFFFVRSCSMLNWSHSTKSNVALSSCLEDQCCNVPSLTALIPYLVIPRVWLPFTNSNSQKLQCVSIL